MKLCDASRSLHVLVPVVFIALALIVVPVRAGLSGNQVITPHDYPLTGPTAPNNPPFCGMPYADLNLDRITAVEGMDQSGCGTCLRVSNADDPTKSVFVLAVDKGGRGLDVSTTAFDDIFGQPDTPAPAVWEPVDVENCKGIWKNQPQSGSESGGGSSGDGGANNPSPPISTASQPQVQSSNDAINDNVDNKAEQKTPQQSGSNDTSDSSSSTFNAASVDTNSTGASGSSQEPGSGHNESDAGNNDYDNSQEDAAAGRSAIGAMVMVVVTSTMVTLATVL